MGHEEQQSKSGFWVPFILVVLGVSFLILVSDMGNASHAPTEETKTETPAH